MAGTHWHVPTRPPTSPPVLGAVPWRVSDAALQVSPAPAPTLTKSQEYESILSQRGPRCHGCTAFKSGLKVRWFFRSVVLDAALKEFADSHNTKAIRTV